MATNTEADLLEQDCSEPVDISLGEWKSPPKRRSALIKPPVPWTSEDPPLQFGTSWYGNKTAVHPIDFVHGAVFGATGSGKTAMVVKPMVTAAIRYTLADGTNSTVLVIDPKKELIDGIHAELTQRDESERLVLIGDCPAIQMFPSDCELSASDRFDLYRDMTPQVETSENRYWLHKAEAMLTDFLELELACISSCKRRFLATLAKELNVSAPTDSYWATLRAFLTYACQGQRRIREVAGRIVEMCTELGIGSPAVNVFGSFTGGSDTVDQACYVVMSAQPMVNALSDPSIEAFVDLDPIGLPGRSNIDEFLNAGKVIVFQPEATSAHSIAARALKQRFFEAIYRRDNMRQPVFVVADEYQTFISARDTSLLDRARAYRAVALFASQSLASLRHALGNNSAANNVVEVLVTNLPSRFTFRSNCPETTSWLRSQIPNCTEGPHILDARRLALLRPGEAYFMLADGSWGFDRPSISMAA